MYPYTLPFTRVLGNQPRVVMPTQQVFTADATASPLLTLLLLTVFNTSLFYVYMGAHVFRMQ